MSRAQRRKPTVDFVLYPNICMKFADLSRTEESMYNAKTWYRIMLAPELNEIYSILLSWWLGRWVCPKPCSRRTASTGRTCNLACIAGIRRQKRVVQSSRQDSEPRHCVRRNQEETGSCCVPSRKGKCYCTRCFAAGKSKASDLRPRVRLTRPGRVGSRE